MKFLVLAAMLTMGCCTPRRLFNVRSNNVRMRQDSESDSVFGSYSWQTPGGETLFVKYVADRNGFRILDSNAVPVSSSGVRVDGNQGSFDDDFDSYEDFDTYEQSSPEDVDTVEDDSNSHEDRFIVNRRRFGRF